MHYVKRLLPCLTIIALVAATVFSPMAARADINFSGEVTPSDSATWEPFTRVYIGGSSGTGSMSITAGGTDDFVCGMCCIADSFNGTATIDGSGATLSVPGASVYGTGYLYVGFYATGTLNILNGAQVSNSTGWISMTSSYSGSGTVNVDGPGSTWTNTASLDIGGPGLIKEGGFQVFGGTGLLNITNGGAVNCGGSASIGYHYLALGTATVDASTWSVANQLCVGGTGSGVLNIENSGHVSVGGETYALCAGSANGTIHLGGATAGTLTTQGLWATQSQLTGTGTIDTHGLVGNFNLTYDSGPSKTWTITGTEQNITMTLNLGDSNNAGDLGAGYDATGEGVLTILNGTTVYSASGYVAHHDASAGTVTVDGTNSAWINSGNLSVGNVANASAGTGTLNITAGAQVSNVDAYICSGNTDTATVTVDGSTWTNAGSLNIGGNYSSATLNIQNGSTVTTAHSANMGNSYGTTTVTVNGGSTWSVGQDLVVGGATDDMATLHISNGGSVDVAGATFIGNKVPVYLTTSVATIDFGSGGGSLTTQGLYLRSASQLTGTGTMSSKGLVSDLDVTFDAQNVKTLVFDDAGQNVQLTVDMSDRYDVSDLGAGFRGNGSLTIHNGEVYAQQGILGYTYEGSGTATVAGSGARWTNNESLCVGYNGYGEVHILNGGTVSNHDGYIGRLHGSSGQVVVDGASSKWINTGSLYVASVEWNYGVLTIQNGGEVEVADTTYLCQGAESIGSINFGPGGGTLTTRQLYAPSSNLAGAGTILAKGLVSDVDMTFDSSATSVMINGTVAVTLDMSNSSEVGNLGVGGGNNGGILTVRNGAVVYSQEGYLGYYVTKTVGSGGTATVDGGSWINNGAVTLYPTGNGGVLNVMNGGVVAASGFAKSNVVVKGGGAPTYVNLDNGTLRASANTPSGSSFLQAIDGVYVHAGGATIDTQNYDVTINQALLTDATSTGGGLTIIGAGTLTLSGANTYTGLTSVNDGTLILVDATPAWTEAFAPIFSGGSASVGGGKLVFNYGAAYDDALALANIVSAIAGGTISEAYHTPPLLCSGNTATDTITVMNTLYGDSNVDGSVNGTDLNAVLSNYNQSGQTWIQGDFNFDGSVNGTDLNTVLSNYNQSVSFASTAAVPEPSTLLLMVLGLVGLLATRRVRARTHA